MDRESFNGGTGGGHAVLGDITTAALNNAPRLTTPASIEQRNSRMRKKTNENDDQMDIEEATGEVDSSLSSNVASSSARLRMRPEIALFYRTPGMLRFSRRRVPLEQPIDYFAKYKVPDEILVQVFRFLNHRDLVSCVLVCKKMHAVGYDSKLWSSLDLSCRGVKEKNLHALLDRGVQVLRLSQTDIANDMISSGSSILVYPESRMCHLTHLDLGMALCATDVITGLLQRCLLLQALSVEGGLVDERACMAIGRNTHLQYLNLALASGITPDGLRTIFEGCRCLSELNLAWTELQRGHVRILCEMLPPSLKRLDLSGIRGKTDFTDSEFLDLIRCCPQLHELDVSDAPAITEQSLSYLMAGALPKLRVLGLSRCYGIEPAAFLFGSPSTRHLPHLHELKVFGCVTDAGVDVLRRRLAPTVVNETPLSDVARPTTGMRRTSIWNRRVREPY